MTCFISTRIPNTPLTLRRYYTRYCFHRFGRPSRQCFRRSLYLSCHQLYLCRLLHGFMSSCLSCHQLYLRRLLHGFIRTLVVHIFRLHRFLDKQTLLFMLHLHRIIHRPKLLLSDSSSTRVACVLVSRLVSSAVEDSTTYSSAPTSSKYFLRGVEELASPYISGRYFWPRHPTYRANQT
jgi:hypothetical protein